MKKKDIMYSYDGFNFINGYEWICVERKANKFVLMNKKDKRIIVVENAKPCYPYYRKDEKEVKQ